MCQQHNVFDDQYKYTSSDKNETQLDNSQPKVGGLVVRRKVCNNILNKKKTVKFYRMKVIIILYVEINNSQLIKQKIQNTLNLLNVTAF